MGKKLCNTIKMHIKNQNKALIVVIEMRFYACWW